MARKKAAPPPPSGREATKQETRDALLRAGTELFAEQGLDAPSLDAICARAGFTRGAFYVHFADREELIVAVMEAATASFLDTVLRARGPEMDLAEVIAAFGASVAEGRFAALGAVPLPQFLAACARSPALRKRYVRFIERTRERLAEAVRGGQAAGRIRPDVDPALAAGLLVAIALGVGTILELRVPFEAAAHAEALTGLLTRR